jgi:hypothetical protein
MAKSDEEKQRPRQPTQVEDAQPNATKISRPPPSQLPPPRALTRDRLETLRARLQKKFH